MIKKKKEKKDLIWSRLTTIYFQIQADQYLSSTLEK